MNYAVVLQTLQQLDAIAVERFENRPEAECTFRYSCDYNDRDLLVSLVTDGKDGEREVIAESLSWRGLHTNAEQAFREAGLIV